MTLAFVFPGQGSQSVGMLAALAAAEPLVQQTFAEASEVLGYDLWELCQTGPRPTSARPSARSPRCSRPASRPGASGARTAGRGPSPWRATASASTRRSSARMRSISARPCDLVRFRGQVMQAGRAARAGRDGGDPRPRRRRGRSGVPRSGAGRGRRAGQLQRAGPGRDRRAQRPRSQRAIEAAKARGAKRAVLLPVSVPSHSSLMRGAAEKLAARLAQRRRSHARRARRLHRRRAHARERRTASARRSRSSSSSPVRWADTVRAMLASGVHDFVECGPGKVLTALNRRIERARISRCSRSTIRRSLAAALAACRETRT